MALKIQDERIGRYNEELLIKRDEIKALLKEDMIDCGISASSIDMGIDIALECVCSRANNIII